MAVHVEVDTHMTRTGHARRPEPARAEVWFILGLIGLGAAAVLFRWWQDTPNVITSGDWLTNAGRIAGLLAGYSCAVLLLLMARIPAMERGIGTDRLARWHAMGGRYTVSLVAVHVTLIIWGYSLTDNQGVVHEGTQIVFHYPDMIKASIGTLLLFATGILSARAARRRLRYETWHYLHFATYVAVFLIFFHALSNGASFIEDKGARDAWYVLYIGVALILVWFRFLAPVRSALRHQLQVVDVRRESPGVVSVYVRGRQLSALEAEPGQFFRWRFLAPGMWWTANPYSLSAPVHGDLLRITVKAAGGHSEALFGLRKGTKVVAEGPYGAFTAGARKAPSGKVLLLGGGIGVTPLRTLFETMPGDVVLVYLARTEKDLALRAELDVIAGARGGHAYYFVDQPAKHALPLTARALKAVVPDLAERDVYLCGPPGMTHAAGAAVRDAGVPRRHIHHESFAL